MGAHFLMHNCICIITIILYNMINQVLWKHVCEYGRRHTAGLLPTVQLYEYQGTNKYRRMFSGGIAVIRVEARDTPVAAFGQ